MFPATDTNTNILNSNSTLNSTQHRAISSHLPGYGSAEACYRHRSPWNTYSSLRVDLAAAATYLLGPLSALLFLVFEKDNDFVRFHAYQSALLTTPLVMLRLLVAPVGLSVWIQNTVTVLLVLVEVSMALRAFIDAYSHELRRFSLPFIGDIADNWVSEE